MNINVLLIPSKQSFRSALILFLCMALWTVSCKEEEVAPDAIIGSWTLESITITGCNDPDYNESETCDVQCPVWVFSETTINADGDVIPYTKTATTISADGDIVNYTISGNTLTLTLNEGDGCMVTIVLKKN